MEEKYSSKPDTYAHVQKVAEYITIIEREIHNRALGHDYSKYKSPEVDIFDEYTPKLKTTTYGSDKYKEYLKQMKVALDHHYANNRHHPEYFMNGIQDMSLVDLIEMLCDWKAATLRHDNGDIIKSLEINQKRFGFSDELKKILKNTLDDFHME